MFAWQRVLGVLALGLASTLSWASSAPLYSARGLLYQGAQVEAMRDGGSVVVGTQSMVRLGVVVLRLDAQGAPLWHRLIELPAGHLAGDRVREAPDGLLVLASEGLATDLLPDHLVVIKLDPAGQILWQRRIQGAGLGGFLAYDLAALPDGGALVSALDFGADGKAWAARLAADGQLLWQVRPGPGAATVQAAHDGAAMVAGDDLVMRLGDDGQPEWVRRIAVGDQGTTIVSLRPLPDGGWLLAGGHGGGGRVFRPWLMRVSAAWEPQWLRTFSAPGCGDEALALDAQPAPAGGYLVTAYSGFCSDSSVLRVAEDGTLLWQGTPDYADLDPVMHVLSFAPAPGGGYVATGTVADVDLPVRMLVVHADAQGQVARCRAVRWLDDRYVAAAAPAVAITPAAAAPQPTAYGDGPAGAGTRSPRLLKANACRL